MPTPPLSDSLAQEALQAYIDCNEVAQDAAALLGLPTSTFRHRLREARRRGLKAESSAEQKAKIEEAQRNLRPGEKVTDSGRIVPLSEDERKFHVDWGPAECIAELRRIAFADPDRVVTRNYFRVHSAISESTWTRYFGTFQEFKAQAEITTSRHVKRLEKSIAKHASVDNARALMEEKIDFEGRYLKPENGVRWKTMLVGSDVHDIDCDPFWRRVFIDTARRAQPDTIVINGDLFDFPEFGKYSQDPRTWGPTRRIDWVHAFWAEIRDAAPDSELWLIEGNHEFRLFRHLSEATPAMQQILHELHGFDIPRLLGLEEYEINMVGRMNLGTFTEGDIRAEQKRNWWIFHNSFLCHHFPEGRRQGYPGCNGHHHKHLVWSAHSPIFKTYEWHQLGAGHKRSAEYCDGEMWSNGFSLVHIDTASASVQQEYIDVRDHCVVGGKWYVREPGEWEGVTQSPNTQRAYGDPSG